jgi:chromosomal replication initiator protein
VEQSIELTAETLWTEVAGRLKGALNDSTYRTWFGEVEGAEVTDDTFVLAVPNDFTREWIEGHFLELIRAAVRDATGQQRRVQLTVAETGAVPDTTQPPAQRISESGLNAKYTFDLFVIGSSNRFAHAAALAVAEAPAQAYNPLFIYGSTGLGKTHLLQAIAQYVMEHPGNMSVRYVTSESFVNDFINSLRDKRIEGFKQRYRNYDLLLIDDVQFFEGKERFQEEFFHTFNSLYESGSQIVLSSDRPPKQIPRLEDRLRTRLEWGLITDVQPPEFETRLAILRMKAEAEALEELPAEVLNFIASNISDNVRQLEGALIRVAAYSSLNRLPLSEEVARQVLIDLLPPVVPRVITPELILDETAKMFGFTVDDLCGRSRRRPLVIARQIGMYVFRELTDFSYPKIAEEFGGRDHTTVIHAVEKIKGLMTERHNVFDQVNELMGRIRLGTGG